ncbi:hypothetical protein K439DRAFT_1531058 [Ramaria rubella]|nr:hypothetical protein K439DRAFT_1531058 [Ramaria rubella]
MAQQFYAAHLQHQNRGTLPPGQTILVNKHTVQVEKYLSQVRSEAPINNTTQHVLKRIAVSDEAMLNDVKKEVDIMRLLRGHPNIVNFIDASWHALPNGLYEVFILMELCSGGGIIDMMNRRLRERLTEAEILQIFVDVCEAVALMHNLKPPLLHRDLKVENILQSSLTRYKLCDFGSSTPVASRPPSSIQEIRASEADLNRHTTLQYRAPEMVDVHLRRPIDEKSDVWALGVLLYKLCYYTTPFEEHGPLAILNVQYKIPPYPVYSTQMNSLISSMLRELGTQRPSVFEVLYTVHRMRGTTSSYKYDIPPQRSLRPSLQQPSSSGLDDLVSIRTGPILSTNVAAPSQVRQTVLDAIAPMRRGRPTASCISIPSLIQQENGPEARKLEEKWNTVRVTDVDKQTEDPWNIGLGKVQGSSANGFDGFGDSFVKISPNQVTSTLVPSTTPVTVDMKSTSSVNLNVQKDAFEGLGGIVRSHNTSPTLAEVASNPSLSGSGTNKLLRLNGISRTPVPAATNIPISPRLPASRTGLARYNAPASLPAEERYPSLDQLDQGWQLPILSLGSPTQAISQHELGSKLSYASRLQTENNNLPISNPTPSETKTLGVPLRGEARSQQVTGTAMRDQAGVVLPTEIQKPSELTDKRHLPIGSSPTKYRPVRPALARKHRSSLSIKSAEPRSPPKDWLTGDDSVPVTNPLLSQPSGLKPLSGAPPPDPSNVLRVANTNVQQDIISRQATQSSGQETPPLTIIPGPYNQRTTPEHISVKAPRSLKEVPRRQDSSSDDAEGPEDVDGHVTNTNGSKRTRGRQSSVHDLVDLYGGGTRIPVDRERTEPPSPVFGRQARRTSGILVDLSLPPTVTSTSLLSPASIVPESRAELTNRRDESSPYGVQRSSPTGLEESRNQLSRPASRASPNSSATDRSDRPRPQSMFIFPSSKPSTESNSNLRAPETPRHRVSPRRGSISDMVDLYEGLGGGVRSKDPPIVASKPAGLRVSETPSPVTSRFPALSPTSSSFPMQQMLDPSLKLKPKPRRSPTEASFYNYPVGLSSTDTTKNNFASRVPRRQSVSPGKHTPRSFKSIPTSAAPSKPIKPLSLSIPKHTFSTTAASTPGTDTDISISSPSPERPFQGVSKLIDQWQKKTEEAGAERHPGPRAPGRPVGPRTALGKREASQARKGF